MVSRVEFIETVVAPLGVNGALIPISGFGATPFIVNADGSEGAQAAAFAGRTGNTTASSLATNAAGRVSYWLDPGDYNIHMSDQQIPPRVSSWVQGFSATTFSIAQILASNSPPPVGGIELYAGAIDPIDGDGTVRWMISEGRALSRTIYSELFDIIGTAYGVGDGVTTFNIPNMKGKFPLGKSLSGTGSALGSGGGALDHSHVIPGLSIPALAVPALTIPDLSLFASADAHHHPLSNNGGAKIAVPNGPGLADVLTFYGPSGRTVSYGNHWDYSLSAEAFVSTSTTEATAGLEGNTDDSGTVHVSGVAQASNTGTGSTAPGTTGTGTTGIQNPAYLTVNYLIKVL